MGTGDWRVEASPRVRFQLVHVHPVSWRCYTARMSELAPEEREVILNRIRVLDIEAIKLSRKVAFDGIRDWSAWDKLQQERSQLEKKLWGDRPPDV